MKYKKIILIGSLLAILLIIALFQKVKSEAKIELSKSTASITVTVTAVPK